jgi:glutamate decarboxylase
LPEELIFHVNYLGGDQPTFNLNFSRGANQIIAQYYNFLNLGREGYERVMNSLQKRAQVLTKRLEESGRFEALSKLGHLPVVAFTLRDNSRYTVFDISDKLRERGWIVPAYTLAPNAENISVLRVVVREDFTEDMSDMLINDIERAIENFEKAPKAVFAKAHERKTRGVC